MTTETPATSEQAQWLRNCVESRSEYQTATTIPLARCAAIADLIERQEAELARVSGQAEVDKSLDAILLANVTEHYRRKVAELEAELAELRKDIHGGPALTHAMRLERNDARAQKAWLEARIAELKAGWDREHETVKKLNAINDAQEAELSAARAFHAQDVSDLDRCRVELAEARENYDLACGQIDSLVERVQELEAELAACRAGGPR